MSESTAGHWLRALTEQVGKVVFGANELTRLGFITLMVRGHLLLEGLPGTGKTLFARCFARSLGLASRRVQCTPDLMPGDLLGANIFNFSSQSFSLTKGPIFTEFLLVDEINRTPPKTQSALLEAMQERRATIDGTSHVLSHRFFVMATQNPIEQEGTYPLPEAQLDRFLFKLVVPYPDEVSEQRAVWAHCSSSTMPDLDALGMQTLMPPEVLDELAQIPARIHVDPAVVTYAVALARATRSHPALLVGLSTRATTMLAAAARAAAACEGRPYVIPDDIKSLFIPLARHRVVLSGVAQMEGTEIERVLQEVISQVPAPR